MHFLIQCFSPFSISTKITTPTLHHRCVFNDPLSHCMLQLHHCGFEHIEMSENSVVCVHNIVIVQNLRHPDTLYVVTNRTESDVTRYSYNQCDQNATCTSSIQNTYELYLDASTTAVSAVNGSSK